ncbi:hypothetical protein [Ferruginivarius sediminum]|uniref:Uncharacterized protein n=1 Tax=Ferruginivarius sediminum TaxID=2661937 RepID=A0A369T7B6_9PROT|nr:hypothetical protein [Ferruginivarius sediminum]RDD60762.1 hypothetical protein DRB17_16320 [Ferruginivarius sediminum]
MDALTTEEMSQATDDGPSPPHRGASYSVESALSGIGSKKLDAPRMAAAVCEVHPEYMDNRLGEVVPTLRDLEKGEPKGADAWIAEVDRLVEPRAAQVIDTPMLVFGLALLDGGVFRVLHNASLIDPLVETLVHAKPSSDGQTGTGSSESAAPAGKSAKTKRRAK